MQGIPSRANLQYLLPVQVQGTEVQARVKADPPITVVFIGDPRPDMIFKNFFLVIPYQSFLSVHTVHSFQFYTQVTP